VAKRASLLVGSLPFEDEEACMRRSLDVLGSSLRTLPDGEVGEKSPQFPRGNRIAWVMYAVEKITADLANWEMIKAPARGADGMAVDYQGIQKLKPRRSPREMPQYVSLGYDTFFERSYPIFQRLRDERGLPLRFQLGVPTGFAMGFAFASEVDWIRYTGAFNTVLAREVNRAVAQAPDDVVVQLEVPPELYAAYQLPTLMMSIALRPIYDLLSKITPGTRIGMHLCLGDFHNEALIHPKTLGKMVEFSNRMVAHWPRAYPLDYVHYPLAEGAVPPTTDPYHYEPLHAVKLPPDTRFVAGFVHEKLSLDDNQAILHAIEDVRGGPVDLAASCGLGRRTPDEANRVLDLMAALVDA
jgi:hypothetical protein